MTDLTPELLLHGYSIGIFPMAKTRNASEVFWVDPRRRGTLPLNGFRLSRSLAKHMRKTPHSVRLNLDFAAVVDACADRDETWINAEIRALYIALHQMGHAHSLEIWQDETLIGGVYGVVLGGAFFGESMFSRQINGSKMALVYLVDHLRQTGFSLFDTQFLTDHLASLGAIEISRAEYHLKLEIALEQSADITARPLASDPYPVLQRMTQTS